MATPPYRILILDDDPDISTLLSDFLKTTLPCDITAVKTIHAFWPALEADCFDLLFLDLRLPDGNGMDVLRQLQGHSPYLPTVVMTGAGSEQTAVEAIRLGAVDYLPKSSLQLESLPALVEKAVQARELRTRAQQVLQQVTYQSLLLDHMRDAIVVWDQEGKITYWNQAAEELYGQPACETLEQPAADIYFKRFYPRIEPCADADTKPVEVERLILQDGHRPRWISSKLTPLYDPQHPSRLIGFMDVTRDITARKIEQEQLNHQQMMIQRVVDVSPTIIYIIDLEEQTLSYCNPQLTKILGHPLDEVKEGSLQFLARMLHPDDKRKYLEHLKSFRTQPDDTIREIEIQFLTKYGRYRWLSCRETVFTRGADGLVKEIIGVALDVTDRVRFEANLSQRLEAERLISTISTYFINLLPAETERGIEEALELVRQFLAAKTCAVWLYEDEQLIVRHTAGEKKAKITIEKHAADWLSIVFETHDYLPLTPASAPPEYLPAFEFLFDSPESRQAVFIPMVSNYDLIGVMAITGTWQAQDWENTYLSLLRTFSEIIVNSLVQKQFEEALIASENRYRAIVDEHQSMMICRFRPDFSLTYANLTYCRYFDQESEQALNTSFLANVHPDDHALVRATLGSIGADNLNQVLAHRCTRTGRPLSHLEWTVRAIHNHHGEIIEYQAVGRDITERIEMEAKVASAQAQLMQSARLAAIGQLAASVAHQISNPLTTIIADAQLLTHMFKNEDPEYESATAIMQAGWRAQRVIQLLMKFSQPDDEDFQPVSINDTIEKAILLTGVHMQSAGVNLHLDLSPDRPQTIGNERQLIDLWVNLILMALSGRTETRKATTIWIKTRLSNSEKILIEISDDGCPITADRSESIFEPTLIPTGSNEWTGIELSVCREIIRQHNGEISAQSDDNTTTFSVLLPRGS